MDAVDTVATDLLTKPVNLLSKLVLKLWYTPVPTPIKYRVDAVTLLLIPTKEPVDPNPTLAVAIPIKSLDKLAAYNVCPWVRAKPSIPLVDTDTPAPVDVV